MNGQKISNCTVTGLERSVQVVNEVDFPKQKAFRVAVKINRYKDGKLIKNRGLKPYEMIADIKNDKESRSYDELITDSKQSTYKNIIEWLDKNGEFDKEDEVEE